MTRRGTAYRIHENRRPSMVGAKVLPMSDEDRSFWRLLAMRREGRNG